MKVKVYEEIRFFWEFQDFNPEKNKHYYDLDRPRDTNTFIFIKSNLIHFNTQI